MFFEILFFEFFVASPIFILTRLRRRAFVNRKNNVPPVFDKQKFYSSVDKYDIIVLIQAEKRRHSNIHSSNFVGNNLDVVYQDIIATAKTFTYFSRILNIDSTASQKDDKYRQLIGNTNLLIAIFAALICYFQ